MKLKSSLILLLGLFQSLNSLADGSLKIALTKYSAGNYLSQERLVWGSEGSRFKALDGHHTKTTDDICDNLLSEIQNYPLRKMVSIGYLTPVQAEEYRKMAVTQIAPPQVSILEAFEKANDDEYFEETKAFLATFSGQVWNLIKGKIDLLLPWQLEPKFKEFSDKLDRKKYKYLWEWGRAAQEDPKTIDKLLSAATITALQDLKTFKGSIDEGFVMFHSKSEIHTRAYRTRFPNSRFPPEAKDNSDALFLVPLTELLKKFPPREFSSKVNSIVQLSQGKINDLQALDLINEFKLLRWDELDFEMRNGVRQNGPIVMTDISDGRAFQTYQLLTRAGLDGDIREKVMGYLWSQRPNEHLYNFGQYPDVTDSQMTLYHYREHNAVEISNLDSKLLSQPNYVKAVLFGSYMYYLAKLQGPVLTLEGFSHMAQVVDHYKIKFGISTFDDKIAAAIQELNPDSSETVYYPKQDYSESDMPGKEWIVKGHIHSLRIFYFTPEQIKKIPANEREFEQIGQTVKPGTWRVHYLLTDTDVF